MVARKGEVQRLQEDLTTAQDEAQQLRSEIGQLTAKASETQKRLHAEVSLHISWHAAHLCLLLNNWLVLSKVSGVVPFAAMLPYVSLWQANVLCCPD